MKAPPESEVLATSENVIESHTLPIDPTTTLQSKKGTAKKGKQNVVKPTLTPVVPTDFQGAGTNIPLNANWVDQSTIELNSLHLAVNSPARSDTLPPGCVRNVNQRRSTTTAQLREVSQNSARQNIPVSAPADSTDNQFTRANNPLDVT